MQEQDEENGEKDRKHDPFDYALNCEKGSGVQCYIAEFLKGRR